MMTGGRWLQFVLMIWDRVAARRLAVLSISPAERQEALEVQR